METPETGKFGSSLIVVPSVQELAKQEIHVIPPRYIRSDDQQGISLSADSTRTPSLPIIDMDKLSSNSELELEKLDSACKHWGFFQVVNHGISSTLLEKFKTEIQGFFNMPFDEKKKLWQQPGDHQGFGQHFVVSEEQKLDWADLFYINTLPLIHRESKLFTKIPLPLRDTLKIYSQELHTLAITILGKMAEALKVDANEMDELFSDELQTMRFNYYPMCPQPEQVIGLTPHSDASALTILLHVNETEGLQVMNNGKWVPVKPVPNSFIVNVGDSMEIVSNGVYRSILHRAMVNSSRERLSVATFCSGKLDAELGPAKSLITPSNPALFRRVPMGKYIEDFLSRKLAGKSNIDFNKI